MALEPVATRQEEIEVELETQGESLTQGQLIWRRFLRTDWQ